MLFRSSFWGVRVRREEVRIESKIEKISRDAKGWSFSQFLNTGSRIAMSRKAWEREGEDLDA